MSAAPDPQLTYPGKALVRVVGAILITGCCVMLVLGFTFLADWLQGPRYVLYWSWCFLLAAMALFVALLDMMLVRRAGKQKRRELFREQFKR